MINFLVTWLLDYLLTDLDATYQHWNCGRQNQTILPRFLGWTDNQSGLDRFEAEVYFLQPGTSGSLVQPADTEVTATVKPDQNNFQFIARRPGVYAIVVTVYDEANNTARARKIFNYDEKPAGFQETNAPVYFMGPSNSSSSFTTDRDGKATLSWAGRFVFKSEELSRSVEPWPIDENTIDDVYGTTFGLRSISAITGSVGLNSITCKYRLDPTDAAAGGDQPEGGAEGPEGPVVRNCSIDQDAETATLDFDGMTVNNGDGVTVWLNASDYNGNTVTVRATATQDSTMPVVGDHNFAANRDDVDFS